MNDFFLAKNASLKVDFDDVEVHQIRMRDFDKWMPCADPVKDFLKNKDYSDEELAIGYKELPFSGQVVRIYSPNKYPELHNQKGTISGINLKEINTDYFEAELTIGNPYTFTVLISRLQKQTQKVVRLIDENAPTEDYMCNKKEILNIQEVYSDFTNLTSYPFRCGLHKLGTVIIGKS